MPLHKNLLGAVVLSAAFLLYRSGTLSAQTAPEAVSRIGAVDESSVATLKGNTSSAGHSRQRPRRSRSRFADGTHAACLDARCHNGIHASESSRKSARQILAGPPRLAFAGTIWRTFRRFQDGPSKTGGVACFSRFSGQSSGAGGNDDRVQRHSRAGGGASTRRSIPIR